MDFVVTPEGSSTLGRYRPRWEDNIKVNLKEIGWSDVGRVYLAQHRNLWKNLGT
jgi:hypothetical protein